MNLAALLLLAATGSASVNGLLAIALAWAALIVAVLVAIARYRDHLEASANDLLPSVKLVDEVVIAYIGPKRLVRKGRRR